MSDDRPKTLAEQMGELNDALAELGRSIADELHLEHVLSEYMIEIVMVTFYFMGLLMGYVLWGRQP